MLLQLSAWTCIFDLPAKHGVFTWRSGVWRAITVFSENEDERMSSVRYASSVLAISAMFLLGASAARAQDSVANTTYDVYVSQSFAGPPYTPFHDCFRFSATQVCSDGCGDCGPFSQVNFGPGGVSVWSAAISCGGLNLVVTGTTVGGKALPADVFGASMIGKEQATTFGLEGAADSACALSVPKGAKNPYSN